jgi:hypothetical protein
MWNTVRISMALLVGLGSANLAKADLTIVAPGALAATEGNSNNGYPFNLGNFGLPSDRYQQVYAASDFGSLGGPELITQILFRPDAGTGAAFSSTLSNVLIDLSTTSATPGTLSSTFANNVGADNTTVFSGALSLSSSDSGPSAGPKNFDIVITLMTPFLYNPASGDLLLDVTNFGGGSTTQFDATVSSADVARVFTEATSGGSGATSGTYADNSGLVTEFKFTTPEPSAFVLLLTTVFLIAFLARKRIVRGLDATARTKS